MSVQINYKEIKKFKDLKNLILFVDNDFNISKIKKHFLKSEFSFINDLLKTADKKKKILSFDINSKKKSF